MIETEGPFVFHERSFCENLDPFGRVEFSVKIPAVEKEVHWTTCVFHEGPFCENGDPLDNLGFSKKVLSVRTWSPIPTSKGLSNNKGKKAPKVC
jgi:hypothetical protein